MAKENFIKVEQVIHYTREKAKMRLTLKIFSRNNVLYDQISFFSILVHPMRCHKLNLPVRQDTSLFSSGFRRLFAKLLLRNWDEGGVRATKRNEFTFFSRPPFSFPRKKLEHIPSKAHFFHKTGYRETIAQENVIKLLYILF